VLWGGVATRFAGRPSAIQGVNHVRPEGLRGKSMLVGVRLVGWS